MSFRDKKNDPVTFEINREKESEWSKNTAKAVEIYESGKNLSENREFLIRYLPIKFIYNNGEASSWSVYQGDADSVHPKTYNFRANIVDALIQGHKLEDLITHVTNQKQGSLNTKRDVNNKPVKNKVLDIDYIRDVLKGAVE